MGYLQRRSRTRYIGALLLAMKQRFARCVAGAPLVFSVHNVTSEYDSSKFPRRDVPVFRLDLYGRFFSPDVIFDVSIYRDIPEAKNNIALRNGRFLFACDPSCADSNAVFHLRRSFVLIRYTCQFLHGDFRTAPDSFKNCVVLRIATPSFDVCPVGFVFSFCVCSFGRYRRYSPDISP